MITRQTGLLSILLVCALVTGWLLLNQGAVTPRGKSGALGPNLFVDTMDLRVTGRDGLVHYHLQADAMQHVPGDDSFDLENPQFHTLGKQRSRWQASAGRGNVSSDGETVRLLDSVEIQRLPGAGARRLDIETSELLVKPEQQTASSDQGVVIQSPGFRVEAHGMDADFRNGRLELRSRVRGRIDAAG